MNITVNGNNLHIEPLPGEMLADLLRYRLGLTGTKIGCNEAECGACTVLIDNVPVLSCNYPAARADGKSILTIEGLVKFSVDNPKNNLMTGLHPIQKSFILNGAVQCGFCSPGQILTAYALLQYNPNPTEIEVRQALKDNLCRCAGYPSIIKSVMYAAALLRGEPPSLDGNDRLPQIIGTNRPRPDAVAKVTGSSIFTDDLSFTEMTHARVKRAGVPHAIVKKIDIEKARGIPGVLAILTASDIPGIHTHGLVISDWPILVGVGEPVRFVGDAVAIVAAETREIATEALKFILVDFEKLPVITDPVLAHLPDAPHLHPNGNLLKHIKVRKGSVEQGFSEADIILEHTFHTPIVEHAFLEPECSIARPLADGRMEVYVGSQIPYSDRSQVAAALNWPEERVRIIGMTIGGGFGGKEDITGQIHAALLAQAINRPVKLLFDRQESMVVHPKRHATQIRVKLGARENGRLTAIESELYGDTGAYASLGEKVMTRATTHSSGPYDVPHARADCYAMYTNNPPAGAFRGFGVTQSCFAVESMMDSLAEKLGINPIEIRRINALKVGSITNTGQVLNDSVGLTECIERVEEELVKITEGRNPFDSIFSVPSVNDYYPSDYGQGTEILGDFRRAWGFAVAYKNTGLGGGAPDKASVEIEVYPDGMVEVRTSSAEIGQGLVTVLQMIVAEEMNLPMDKVRVFLSDTDLTPDGGPTTASRQTYVTGNAARRAAQALHQAIISTLAEKYDTPPEKIRFEEGLAVIHGRSISMGEIAQIMKSEGRKPISLYEYWAPTTTRLGQPGDMHFAYSFAAQAAEVEVNLRTGEVKVLRVIAANDVGKAINPLGLQGQVEGGIIMALGNALTEHFIVENGYILTDRLARYRIPSIIQAPEIISIIVEHPTDQGPYGAKGVGELSSIPTIPAITNAIYRAVGVRIDHLPVDQEELLWKMKEINNP